LNNENQYKTHGIAHAGFRGFLALVARKKVGGKLISFSFEIPHETLSSNGSINIEKLNQINYLLKKLLFIFFNLLCISSFSQTIHLDYVPKGGVIKFHFNNLICYTDTNSLFSIYKTDTIREFSKKYHSEVENVIRKHLKDDTVVFTKNFYLNVDIFPGENVLQWFVWDDLRILTRTNKILIFDSQGNRVEIVKIKKKGKRKDCYSGKYFINQETKEELFLYKRKKVCLGEVNTY
jgi:hypothetical protein